MAEPPDTPTGAQPPHRPRHRSAEAGNAMVLMPIGVLVMLLLAGLAVDSALQYRAHAALENAATALANDAAAAIDTGSMFDTGTDIDVDPGLLDRLAAQTWLAADLDATCRAVVVDLGRQPRVEATCNGWATTAFRGVIGRPNRVPSSATGHALLVNQ